MTDASGDKIKDLHHPLILSSRVVGTPVFDRAGQRLGHIDDLSIEKKTGKTVYAVMSFGGFLGIGGKMHPVPWVLLDYNLEWGGYSVPIHAESLKDAPSYDGDEIRALGGPDYRIYGDAIFGYYGTYGAVPYW
jgi:hypothetical protein